MRVVARTVAQTHPTFAPLPVPRAVAQTPCRCLCPAPSPNPRAVAHTPRGCPNPAPLPVPRAVAQTPRRRPTPARSPKPRAVAHTFRRSPHPVQPMPSHNPLCWKPLLVAPAAQKGDLTQPSETWGFGKPRVRWSRVSCGGPGTLCRVPPASALGMDALTPRCSYEFCKTCATRPPRTLLARKNPLVKPWRHFTTLRGLAHVETVKTTLGEPVRLVKKNEHSLVVSNRHSHKILCPDLWIVSGDKGHFPVCDQGDRNAEARVLYLWISPKNIRQSGDDEGLLTLGRFWVALTPLVFFPTVPRS